MTLTNDQIDFAIQRVWEKYKTSSNMPLSTMLYVVVDELGVDSSYEEIVHHYLIQTQVVVKGRNGGVQRPVAFTSSQPVVAVNNHICPCCGNTSCSKSERICWKCGGDLH